MSRPKSHRPSRSAIGLIQLGRQAKLYRQVASVRPSGRSAKFHPPENDRKKRGPSTMRMPTWWGGRNVTYSDTMTRPCRNRVQVRTPAERLDRSGDRHGANLEA